MWINKANFLIVRLRVKRFMLPLVILPFRCIDELVEGLMDFVMLFRIATAKVIPAVSLMQSFLEELQAYGNLDLVNIDAYSQDGPVKISVLLR